MKRIFNLITIFFIFSIAIIFSFLSKTTFDSVQHPVNHTGYIQNIKKDVVVLLSNNTLKSKITTRKQTNNTGFSNIYPFFTVLKETNNLLISSSQNFNKNYIYNVSSITNESQKIRAP